MSQAALAFLLALVTAAPPLARLPAEPARAFACRERHVPESRACSARCAAVHQADEEARSGCVHGCTVRGLRAMADCRARPAAPPASAPSLAAR